MLVSEQKLETQYFRVRDKCRKQLLPYLDNAISLIPQIKDCKVLDVGCGSGVPSLFIVEKFDSHVTAIDIDRRSINEFQRKVKELNYQEKFTIHNSSLNDVNPKINYFDIILAEGFLNVIGFEKGFINLLKHLKPNGYFIIHDDYQGNDEKTKLIGNNNCEILDSFSLDENIWWDKYCSCLENNISKIENSDLLELFKSDIKEVEMYKEDPTQFRSRYYTIRKK